MDVGDTATYSITGGNDAAQFILTSTGELSFRSALNFEIPSDFDGDGIYQVEITADDGKGGTNIQLVSVTVTDGIDMPVGLPGIIGIVVEDEILTADTSAISDEDGLGVYRYQWLRDGSVITDATENTYILGDADVTHQISVQVTYIDGNGTLEGPLTSQLTAAVENVNDPSTGRPRIVGIVTEDQTLQVDTSDLGDNDGLGSFRYQWYRDGSPIDGATESEYVLGDDDVSQPISVQLSYTDFYGNEESTLMSAATAAVVNVNDAPVIASSSTVDASENQSSVFTVTATDVDHGDILSFSITGGADGGKFSISSNGELEFVNPQDFENFAGTNADGSYSVEITVVDKAGARDVQTISVTVTDVNDTPTISSIEVAPTDDSSSAVIEVDENIETLADEPAGEVTKEGVVGQPTTEQVGLNLGGLIEDAPVSLAAEKVSGRSDEPQQERSIEDQGVGYKAVPLKFIDLTQLDMVHHSVDLEIPVRVAKAASSVSFVKELNQLNRDLDKAFQEDKEHYQLRSELIVGSTLSITAGIVSWLLRGGALLASFMSSVPLWKQLDPLPILGAEAKKRKELKDREDDDTEDDKKDNQVEDIFDDEGSK